jgi:hypothetical protein
MKKLLILMVAALMVFSASPGWAAPVLGPWEYTSPIDSILAYDYLATASDAEEQAFVADVLNITTEQLLQTYGFVKVETPFQGGGALAGSTALSDFNPGFSWVYAVVKVDGPNDYSYLFVDDKILPGGDDRLNTPSANTLPFNMIEIGAVPTGPLGISHISFFTTAVPEPLSLLLLGFGLVGLAGVRRLKK